MYTSVQNIEDYLGRSLTTAETEYYNQVMAPALTAYLNRITGLSFNGAIAVTATASGNGTSFLTIPLMQTVTQVKDADDNTISTSDYATYPNTAPFHALKNKNGTWEDGLGNYTVIGTAGTANNTVPPELVRVATELASNGFAVRTDGVKSEKVGDWSATYTVSEAGLSPSSLDILDSYKRLSMRI